MKHLVLQLIVLLIVFSSFSQQVSNVKFRQDQNKIIVNYDLMTTKSVEVKLYCSLDGGLNFGNWLYDVTGDVGPRVVPGSEKEIVWNVLASRKYLYGENIVFKVEARINLIKMVFVEGGSFQMGNFATEPDESPVHEVFLNDYYISKFEVTQKQWTEIMGKNPSYYRKKDSNLPVESIYAEDIKSFLLKLNTLTGKNFRLPTEAEWEYAAKGGQKSKNTIYSGSDNLNEVSWNYNNSHFSTQIVGAMNPNELGIHDMSGNVWEICSDFYSEDYYKVSPKENPKGPNSGDAHVQRGGAYGQRKYKCSVSNRGSLGINKRSKTAGFRLVNDTE